MNKAKAAIIVFGGFQIGDTVRLVDASIWRVQEGVITHKNGDHWWSVRFTDKDGANVTINMKESELELA